MRWQDRLIELVAVGGTLAGCTNLAPGGGVPCGNANPDPCICGRTPENSPQCVAERKCAAEGKTWEFYGPPPAVDAGDGLWGTCGTVVDAGTGLPDAAPIPDAPGD
jgi:hypothetical protein